MATNDSKIEESSNRLAENLARVEELSQRLICAIARRDPSNPTIQAPGPDLMIKAGEAYLRQFAANPAKLFEMQMKYWSETVRQFADMQKMISGTGTGSAEPPSGDKTFSHPLWNSNPYFKMVRDQYLLVAETVRTSLEATEDLDPVERHRIKYFTDQIVDMLAPTNFLATNPEALEKAIETEGESLVRGLENLVADLEASDGQMVVRLADETAFKLGGNIATTPGKVVFQNKMMELIQYEPTTEQVYATPVVIFPPWINKFYILDLKAQNSLIKWLTEQGYTVFIVSWVNPDRSYADVGMEDYVEHGFMRAMSEVKEITGQKQINAVGYCIAGTTLSLTLALLKSRGDNTVKSATFFTALTDFSDQGEFTPFLQNDFIDGIEEEVKEQGILRSFIMARTFSYLRARDLVYAPAVRSYMLGAAPPAFDLLYWNGDGANLPGRMVKEYLRGLCQRNEFAKDGFELFGQKLHVKDVTVPVMSISCETDHIAPWANCYRGVKQMGSKDKTFVVSQSGHIAGIVNPPNKNKYGHYLNDDFKLDAKDWLAGAELHPTSWWPLWEEWLRKRSGKKVDARHPGADGRPVFGDAPGCYVTKKARDC